jgi:hypothetical protein
MTKRNKILLLLSVLFAALGFVLWPVRQAPKANEPTVSDGTRLVSAAVKTPPPTIAQSQTVASQNQTVLAAGAGSSPKRKFADMGVLEANSILKEIMKQDLAAIFQLMVDAGRVEDDRMKQGAIGSILSQAMREKKPSADFLTQLQRFILNSSNLPHERAQVVGVLGAAGTKESVELLLRAAELLTDTALKRSVAVSVRQVGAIWGDGTFHEELSPPLERAWRESQDQELLIFVAVAMAEVGASSGVSLLVDSALIDAGRDEVRARAAKGALAYATILNPSAVPPLAALLANQPSGSAGSILASDTLAKSGIPAAGNALLQWLRGADESVAPQAQQYVAQTRTEAVLKIWESALNSTVPFRSEKNREAIRAGLAEYRQARK